VWGLPLSDFIYITATVNCWPYILLSSLYTIVNYNMQFRDLQPVVVLCFLITLVLSFTGCTGQDSGVPQGEGFSDITPRFYPEKISLEEALSQFRNLYPRESDTMPPTTIHVIWGNSIDAHGYARSWEIGAIQNQKPFLFVYSVTGSKVQDFAGTLPKPEIDTEAIITPDWLFETRLVSLNDLTKGGTREITSLEIKENLFILTSYSENGVRRKVFNAISGQEIRQG